MRTSVLCSVISGESPLTIVWFKDRELLQNKHADIEVLALGEFTSALRIPSLKSEHSGNYTCQAKSFRSTSSFSAEMLVQGEFSMAFPSFLPLAPRRCHASGTGQSVRTVPIRKQTG